MRNGACWVANECWTKGLVDSAEVEYGGATRRESGHSDKNTPLAAKQPERLSVKELPCEPPRGLRGG
jgi:hypothetical protein